MLHILLLLGLLTGARAQSFSCPSSTITSSGVLPAGATNPVIVPVNTNCTINFQIPNGYAVEIKLSATFNATDTYYVIDSLGVPRRLNPAASPISDADIWMSSGTAQIIVTGVTGTSTFLAKFMFTPLSAYKQTTVPTGKFFSLAQVTSGNYYTITSAKNASVIATVGFRNSDDDDGVLQNIYVYDGNNLNTAKYVGRLATLGFQNTVGTSGGSLTLVNFYNTTSPLWVIGNDASTISGFQSYVAVITSSGGSVRGTLSDATEFGSAYTFFCTDCNEFYWTQMAFDGTATSNDGFAAIQGQSPTQGLNKLLNYNTITFNPNQLPQHIPSNMFTLSLFKARINLITNTSTTSSVNAWKTAVDGRQGYLISPSLWTTGASPAYDYRFESNDNMKFNIDYQSLKIASPNEYATVTIDNTTTRYNTTLARPTAFSGVGKVLQASYTGNNTQSSAIVAFRMELSGSPSSSTAAPTSATTQGVVTTTKGGAVTRCGLLAVLVVIVFF